MSDKVQTTTPQTGLKAFFEKAGVQDRFKKILGERASSFLTTVTQIAANNKLLSSASPESIYGAAMTAATLDLPINPNLGFAYILPYGRDAQFQIGYKGLIQLAMRSGQIKSLSVTEVREGQILSEDPLKGFEFDWTKKGGSVIGYAAYMAMVNGFEKTIYSSKADIEAHGRRFSKSFGNGPWKTDFDAMAKKTILKRLISTFAPLSVEMQDAVIRDQAVVKESDSNGFEVEYVDQAESNTGDEATASILAQISDSKNMVDLMKRHASLPAGIHAETWYVTAFDERELAIKTAE